MAKVAAFALLAAFAVALPPRAANVDACTWMRSRFNADDASRAVMAVATDRWWQTTRVELPFYGPGPPRPEPSPDPRDIDALMWSLTPPDTAMYLAQRFVTLATGDGSSHELTIGQPFLVVPLGYTTACSSWPHQTRRWVQPGDTVTFLLDPDESRTVLGEEMIFLQSTYRGPHPGSDEAASTIRSSLGPRRELTGPEFFEFVHLLPATATRPVSASDLAALESWARDNSVEDAYPVMRTLELLRN